MYKWDFSVLGPYALPLLRGLGITFWISFASVLAGTVMGLSLAICRRSRFWVLRGCAAAFIEVFLAMPVLVLLIWAYYCLPLLLDVSLSGMTTAILVFSLSLAAFVAETLRSGIDAIPVGQIEAAMSLRLSKPDVYRFIVLPQAFRIVLPALLTQYLTCLKLSSLAAVIAVYELLHTADGIALATYRPLEIYTVVAGMFLVVILPINMAVRAIESRWGKRVSTA